MTTLENFEHYQVRNFEKLMKISEYLVKKKFNLNNIESSDVLMDRLRYIRERLNNKNNKMKLDFNSDENFVKYMRWCINSYCIYIKKREAEHEQQLLDTHNEQSDHKITQHYVTEIEEMIQSIINAAFPDIQFDQGETK